MTSQRFTITHECAESVPGRVLRVDALVIDTSSTLVEYTITPAVAHGVLTWVGEAQDDAGNQYDDAGGAFGPCADGNCTHGVLTLTPAVPSSARWLRVAVDPQAESGGSSACVLVVPLRQVDE